MQRFLPFALVLVIGAACGFGMGFMIGLSSQGEAPPSRWSEQPYQPPQPEPATPDRRDPDTDRADFDDLPAPATGDEEFTGVVLDFNGDPLASVRVEARLTLPETTDESPIDDLDRDEYLRQHARRFAEVEAGHGQATTDESGRFTIGDLPAGRYTVSAFLDGYELSGDFKNPVTPGRFLAFSAHRVYPVKVRVRMPDGSAPAHASVELKRAHSWGEHPKVDWTPDDPVVRLRAQNYFLTASAGSLRSESEEVSISPNQLTHTITLELIERNGIRGRVVTAGAEVIESIRVRRVAAEEVGDSLEEALLKSGQSAYAKVATGSFEFTNVEPGKYFVGAGWSKRRIDVSTEVTVTEGLVEVRLELPELTDADGIPVTVHDPSGEIARTGVSFQIGYMMPATAPRKPVRKESWIRGVRRRDGSHLLLFDDPLGKALDEQADVELVVHYQNMRRATPISRGSRKLTVRFDDSARFELRVSGLPPEEGRDQIGFRLVNDEQGANYYCQGPDENDAYTCGPVQPDTYELVMWISGRRHDLGPMTLGRGENLHSIDAPPLHTLTVLVGDSTSSRVYLRPVAAPGSYARRAQVKDGRAHYGALLPGEYVLTLNRNGSGGHMNLNIPATSEIEFAASPFNALKILVEDLQGGLAKAGLEDGDLVRGIYETDFESLEQVYVLQSLVKTSEEIPLIIERHGERRTIKVLAEPLRQRETWGGDWVPTFTE